MEKIKIIPKKKLSKIVNGKRIKNNYIDRKSIINRLLTLNHQDVIVVNYINKLKAIKERNNITARFCSVPSLKKKSESFKVHSHVENNHLYLWKEEYS